ncbi:MAG: TRAP transporter substrate-binding protein DctP [Bdellovibrionales bacterium]|nr:TRAP transporter substrate-binding protein DctP [Bdellovibrionales bacterium]
MTAAGHKSDRRQFLQQAAIVGAVAGLAHATPASASERFRWKMTTTWPPAFPVLQEACDTFAATLNTITEQQLQLKVFAGGELVPPLATFDVVSSGALEMGVGAAYYWTGKVPAAGFFCALPFGMSGQQFHAWLYGGGGMELWRELYAQYDLVPLIFGNTGVQMAGWFRREINALSDLQGLKMRIPGYGGKVMAALGVNVVLLPGAEIYTALERGTIDAAEWVSPYHDERLGLYRAAPYYYYPGWQEPCAALELIIHRPAWERLPRRIQAAVEGAAAQAHIWTSSTLDALNGPALARLTSSHGAKLRKLPDDVLSALRKTATEVIAEIGGDDRVSKKIRESYLDFRQRSEQWFEVSEQAMAKAQALG